MVTILYILVFLSLMMLATLFNASVMKQTFLESLTLIYLIEMGTRRMIVVAGSIIGLISSIWIDLKYRKQLKYEVRYERK